jgi:trimeric autotransporter adhesin
VKRTAVLIDPTAGCTQTQGGARAIRDQRSPGPDLADRTIGGQKVGIETLSGANVADGSLFGADIANDSLTGSDIATHAVGSSELDPVAFEPSDIAPKSISDSRLGIAPNAVQGDEVSDNTLTGADINESTLDTPAAAFSKSDGSFTLPSDNTERTIESRRVAPGDYLVLAKASLRSDDGQFATCRITRPGPAPRSISTRRPTRP